jgi:hypothetical protein
VLQIYSNFAWCYSDTRGVIFLHALLSLLCFVSAALVLGQHGRACATSGVSQTREATTATEAARVTAILAIETSARATAVMRDSATLRAKDVNDRAALVERVAMERVSRALVENAAVLDSTHEDVKGFLRKISLHEDDLEVER